MKKVLTVLLILIFIPLEAAALDFNSDPTDGDKIYICGNPDLSPLEYYDAKSGEYRGIVVDMYREIEEKTGLEFVYVSKGEINRQEQMAKNNQTDIVSVHDKNMALYGVSEYYLLNFKGKNIYIGFSEIMDLEKVELIKSCLDEYDDEKLLDMALKYGESSIQKGNELYYTAGTIIILGLLILFLLFKNHKHKKSLREMD
ncbi:MAG: transporter substrate-binding domain-containing protein, partial [Erysipelotrichaceae bacterium]